MTSFDVIVVGAGFAGLSAAAALSAAGARVLVLEARARPGGRASAFVDPVTGEAVDNGQHLMLGCYHETLRFLSRVGARAKVRVEPTLEVPFVDPEGRSSVLSCPAWPSPLHLLGGVLGWNAVGWRDRLSVLRLVRPVRAAQRCLRHGSGRFPALPGETVDAWLTRHGQGDRLRAMLWEPLALAALNQPAGEAASPTFVRVLARMMGPDPADAAVTLPLAPLTELYADPALEFVRSRGGVVRLSSPARVRLDGDVVGGVEARGESYRAESVVVAVPWFALGDVLVGRTGAVEPLLASARAAAACPIVTVNLWLDRPVLPVAFAGMPGRTFQWVFDTRRILGGSATHLSLVCSGAGQVLKETDDSLVRLAYEELAAAVPAARAARVVRGLVVRERRATFSLAPGQPDRPGTATAVAGLVLAGDWIDTGLPATIEGAVTSGHRAAGAIAGGTGS